MMMNEKRKAKMIDRCISAVQSGEWSKEECFQRYPELTADLASIFRISETFNDSSAFEFSENQKRTAKVKLLSELSDRSRIVTKSNSPRYKWQTTKRRFAMGWVLIVTTLLSVLSGTGVVYASGESLPGDILYPVKQWKENVQLLVASDEGDAELFLEFTETRVQEMKALYQQGRFDDLDEVVDGYQNQTQAMEKVMAGVKAENPDEAVRLRTELEQKLQEQARQVQDLLDEESGVNGDQVRDQLRVMLETNSQTRSRINDEEEVFPENEGGETSGEGEITAETADEAIDENTDEAAEETKGNGTQVRNAEFVNASGDEENATFKFKVDNAAQAGVYAELAGIRYACRADGEMIICDIPNAVEKGTLHLHSLGDNSLLYSYSYDYKWLGTKEAGSGGSQNQGTTGGGSHEGGQGGKGK